MGKRTDSGQRNSGAVETHSLEWWITLHHLVVQRTNLGLADAWRTLPARMHSANCKVWWRRNNGLGLFFRLGPLVPVKGNLNATAYNDILANSVLPTLWKQFGERPFPVSAWQCPCAQSEVHTEMVCRDRCGSTWLVCTEPWLQPHWTPLGWIGTPIASYA